MAIENRELAVGTRLVASYKKVQYVCTVEEEEGKQVFVLEDGKRFKSPSSAASAVMGGSAANGWRFWSLEGEASTSATKGLRARTAADSGETITAAPTKPGKKEKSAKLFRRLPATGLDEGQFRVWCRACQKSFITTEAAPEACPEGHRADDPELMSAAVVAPEEAPPVKEDEE
jgi:hypothetical protein